MARVPDTIGEGAVAERIRARRGGALRPIDHVLLHSPALADGWNTLLGTLRGGLGLPDILREIVVLRIAALNEATYEWEAHEEPARRAGLTCDQLTTLRASSTAGSGLFDPTEELVLELTDTITRDVAVPDQLFDRAVTVFDTATLVELVTTIAAYNMVSRLVVAFHIESPPTAGAA